MYLLYNCPCLPIPILCLQPVSRVNTKQLLFLLGKLNLLNCIDSRDTHNFMLYRTMNTVNVIKMSSICGLAELLGNKILILQIKIQLYIQTSLFLFYDLNRKAFAT